MAGVYIHVPFCKKKCPYCDFYSCVGSEAQKEAYTDAVVRAMESYPTPLVADTVYFGGGTPSLLGAERLIRILESVPYCESAEITLEANPGTVTEQDLCLLAHSGFNRISFGVQSTDDAILQTLGRQHSAQQAIDMLYAAKRAGFAHISADLMLCVPGQTKEQIVADIARLASLPIDHISAYLLKIEEGTAFFGYYEEQESDLAAEGYLLAIDALSKHGFTQYEISNFSRNTLAQSRHNLKYWNCEEYLGIGPSAHSMIGGERFYFPRDLDAFLRADHVWDTIISDGRGGDAEEQLMLGLRLTRGISRELIPESRAKTCERMVAEGLATMEQDRFALTPQGFLLSNQIIGALLG